MNTVELTCWDCSATWTVCRRRGQYPRCCAGCLREPVARRVAALAAGGGLDAEVLKHERHGWVVRVTSPLHDEPVFLYDELDLAWLQTDAVRAVTAAAPEEVLA
jgi:hypothetical protein